MTDIPQVGHHAPDPMVLDATGQEHRLSSWWSERPAILAFLRHFG
jgi:hypothetical protein